MDCGDESEGKGAIVSSSSSATTEAQFTFNNIREATVLRHEAMYKNKGLTSDSMRRKREETSIEIRKQKRENDLNKRRQIDFDMISEESTEQTGQKSIYDIVDEQIIDKLYINCAQDIEEALSICAQCLRNNSTTEETADVVVAVGLIPRIVELIGIGETVNIRRCAVQIIGAIVSICSSHTEIIVKAGAVPKLVNLIGNPDRELRELTLFALGNIAIECSSYRDLCIQSGMVQKMVKFPEDIKLTEARCSVWAASNLCRGRDPPVKFADIEVLIPFFCEALHSDDQLIITDACLAYSRLLENISDNSYKVILQPRTVERLVELMTSSYPHIVTASLMVIGNIVSGNDEQTQTVLNYPSSLVNLHRLLMNVDQKTKSDICWMLSNIAAGSVSQIQALFDAGIITTLIQILETETFKVRIEACWVIANVIMGGTMEQVKEIVRLQALTPLTDMLTVMDSGVVVIILKALEKVLDFGENSKINGQNPYVTVLEELQAVSKIEFLTMSPNSEIFVRACAIYENFFLHSNEELESDVFGLDTIADT